MILAMKHNIRYPTVVACLLARRASSPADPRDLRAQTPAPPPPAAPAPAASAEPAKEEAAAHTKTLWEQIKDGGWVMFPIAICSIATFYFIGDGILRTGRKRVLPQKHVDMVKSAFRQGDYVAAYDYCKANASPFTNVCGIAVSLLGEGKEAVEEGMLGELAKESSQLNTQISYLSVIGVCTPMIGLLGTVTGMIKAFETLGASGIGDPSKLSEAIGEVLRCFRHGERLASSRSRRSLASTSCAAARPRPFTAFRTRSRASSARCPTSSSPG